MATKKKDKAAEANAAAKAETKKGGKKELTAEEKKAKREAMKERLKNRAPGQRPNSKQCDIIDLGGGKDLRYERPEVRSPHHLGRNRQGWQSDCRLECHHSGGIG